MNSKESKCSSNSRHELDYFLYKGYTGLGYKSERNTANIEEGIGTPVTVTLQKVTLHDKNYIYEMVTFKVMEVR